MLLGLQGVLHLSGVDAMYVYTKGVAGAVILVYHSVAESEAAKWVDPANHLPPDVLLRHLRFLSRCRKSVTLGEVAAAACKGRTLPPGSVAITFDDGYIDTLTVAAPLLKNFGLTATLFLPTGYIARAEPQWVDTLYAFFRLRTKDRLDLGNEKGGQFDLRNPVQRIAAYKHASAALLVAPYSQRSDLLTDWHRQLAPSDHPPRLTLTWDEVRSLTVQYPNVEIGVHTRDHLDLTNVPVEIARHEIYGCRDEAASALGSAPRHFSFPYGRSDVAVSQIVHEAGFASAVGSGADVLISAESNVWSLPRIEAPRSVAQLGHVTSGAYPALSRLLTGRA